MKELVLNGRTYLSTKRAAEITGYTTDYVGQLARGGKIDAQLVGRNWYIDEDSITKHKFGEVKVNLRKEEEAEKSAPALEVLVESAEEDDVELQKPEVSEEVVETPIVEQEEATDTLEEMEHVWQEWYKAQKSVPTEEDEVLMNQGDVQKESEVQVEELQEEEVPITRVREISRPQIQEAQLEESEEPTPSPVQLPAKRAWGGTGLVLAAVLTIVLVGGLAIGAEHILAQNSDLPLAAAYQGIKDYLLGIQRID